MDGPIQMSASDRGLAEWCSERGIIQVGSRCDGLAAVLGTTPFSFRHEDEDLHGGCFIPTKSKPHGAQK